MSGLTKGEKEVLQRLKNEEFRKNTRSYKSAQKMASQKNETAITNKNVIKKKSDEKKSASSILTTICVLILTISVCSYIAYNLYKDYKQQQELKEYAKLYEKLTNDAVKMFNNNDKPKPYNPPKAKIKTPITKPIKLKHSPVSTRSTVKTIPKVNKYVSENGDTLYQWKDKNGNIQKVFLEK